MQLARLFRVLRGTFLGVCLLSGCGGGGGSSSEPKLDANAIHIACVGDSTTSGAELKNPGRENYPAVLGRQLGRHYNVENFGKRGTSVLTILRNPYSASTNHGQALAFKPKIVVIILGTNDSLLRQFDTNTQQMFVSDYEKLISSFQQASPGLQL